MSPLASAWLMALMTRLAVASVAAEVREFCALADLLAKTATEPAMLPAASPRNTLRREVTGRERSAEGRGSCALTFPSFHFARTGIPRRGADRIGAHLIASHWLSDSCPGHTGG